MSPYRPGIIDVQPVQQSSVALPWKPLVLLSTLAGLGGLLLFALWLRWQYVQTVSYNVDEFTTLWASKRTLETGAPLMPSGVLYTRGLLSTYLTAAFIGLGGIDYTVGRLPSLILGLLSVLAIFYVGKRAWNERVGWVAALGLTMLTEAIVWSGRTRFYAQLLLFALLTLWLAFSALQLPAEQGSKRGSRALWRPYLLFALCFVLALFSQEQTILLYPSLVLAMLLWHGWRYLWQPPVLVAHGVCILAMAARFGIEQVGQPGYFAEVQVYKPYIGAFFNLAAAAASFDELFLRPLSLPWTLCALLAVGVALVHLWRVRGRFTALPRFHQATLFFTLQFCAVLFTLATIVGPQWIAARYLFIVQPCWLLVAAAGVIWLVEQLAPQAVVRWLATGVLIGLLIPWMWPLTLDAIDDPGEGYDAALAYVAEQRQPGDVVMSPAPSACALVMGAPCDYYVAQRSWEPYVIERNGILVDRWSGSPLLNKTDQLIQVIRSAPRVWFVTDRERLGRRYDADFLYLVLQQFDGEFQARDVNALLADGWGEVPLIDAVATLDPPVLAGNLWLTRWGRSAAVPGEPLDMTFFWQQAGPLDRQINTSLQVVAANGAGVGQRDGPPARGMTTTFDFGDIELPDPKRLTLPADMPPGRYRIDVVVYDGNTLETLADPFAVDWFWVGAQTAAPSNPTDVAWQNGIRLVGYDGLPVVLTPGALLNLRLVWTAFAPVRMDYTIFVHLVGPDGNLVAQHDRAPENGFYPTSGWDVQETVSDNYALQLPAKLQAGEYRLLVGLYQPAAGERLLRTDGTDSFELTRRVYKVISDE